MMPMYVLYLCSRAVDIYGISPVSGAVIRGSFQQQCGQHVFLSALGETGNMVVELMV